MVASFTYYKKCICGEGTQSGYVAGCPVHDPYIISDQKLINHLQAENAVLRERLTRCTQDNFELCQDSAILQAAAENIIFKRKNNVPLEDADFEWLERAVGEKS